MSKFTGTCCCGEQIDHDFNNGAFVCKCGVVITRYFNAKTDEYELEFS